MRVLQPPFQNQPEFVEIKGFGQVVVRPLLQSLHGGLHGGVSGHEDDRKRRVDLPDLFQGLDSGNPDHADIHKDQVKGPPADGFNGGFPVIGLGNGIPPAANQGPEHRPMGKIIINNKNLTGFFHDGNSLSIFSDETSRQGRRTEKTVPLPSSLLTRISPPWASTIRWAIGRPSPVPEGRVVK
ncbi:MAG: hypothetical protein A4E72_00606 [Syntrophus sp. PtaU1.Bin208]|nr:MAG: hypothetical protein A4E72_00606 [Syntrophus sp. PtaU1.Bin208]